MRTITAVCLALAAAIGTVILLALLVGGCAAPVVIGTYIPGEKSNQVLLPKDTTFRTPAGDVYTLGDTGLVIPFGQWLFLMEHMDRLMKIAKDADRPVPGGEGLSF